MAGRPQRRLRRNGEDDFLLSLPFKSGTTEQVAQIMRETGLFFCEAEGRHLRIPRWQWRNAGPETLTLIRLCYDQIFRDIGGRLPHSALPIREPGNAYDIVTATGLFGWPHTGASRLHWFAYWHPVVGSKSEETGASEAVVRAALDSIARSFSPRGYHGR